MIIEKVAVTPIKVDLVRKFEGSHYGMTRRCTIITEVLTSEGATGFAYNADTDEDQAEILGIITDELAPAVTGTNPLEHERCWDAMQVATLDVLRDRRLAMQAIACVDTAIWDVVGKVTGQPLHRLWGGFNSSLPTIGIGGYYSDIPGAIEREVEFFQSLGVVGMKFKVGRMSPAEDAKRLKKAVDAASHDFVFIADANQGYTLSEATEFANLVAEFVRLTWFEEPCRWPNDHRSMRDLRLSTGTPVAAGQSEITAAGVRDLLVTGAIDVSNFDASWGGGPSEWLRTAALTKVFDAKVGHHEEAQVGAHLLGAVSNATFLEVFHPDRDPIFWSMIANRPDLKNGHFELPADPGLGWHLDQDFIDRHTV